MLTTYCGFINVLKPPGMSSAQVVGKIRYLLKGAKVGHAGTLDPEACGVLPIMIGKATRLFDYMQQKEKGYITEIAFGFSTTTQDAQGEICETSTNYPSEQSVKDALNSFKGAIWQVPPMVSAIKKDGQPLYNLARQGISLDLPPRQVHVHALNYLGTMPKEGHRLSISCSKGFYVRTLCHDLGKALNCPAHLRFLLRTKSGVFTLDNAYTLLEIEEAITNNMLSSILSPPEIVIDYMQKITVPSSHVFSFSNGGNLPLHLFPELSPLQENENVSIWLKNRLVAIGELKQDTIKTKTWLG